MPDERGHEVGLVLQDAALGEVLQVDGVDVGRVWKVIVGAREPGHGYLLARGGRALGLNDLDLDVGSDVAIPLEPRVEVVCFRYWGWPYP